MEWSGIELGPSIGEYRIELNGLSTFMHMRAEERSIIALIKWHGRARKGKRSIALPKLRLHPVYSTVTVMFLSEDSLFRSSLLFIYLFLDMKMLLFYFQLSRGGNYMRKQASGCQWSSLFTE